MNLRRVTVLALFSALGLGIACEPEPDEVDEDDETMDLRGNECDEVGEERMCADGLGRQFCDWMSSGAKEWGECLDESEIECEPGWREKCEVPELDISEFHTCQLQRGVPVKQWACVTPLVLEFEDAPITFEPAGVASFDITGAGDCIDQDWPSTASPWLAIDLNENGSIDDGRELFGSGTRLASGARSPDGFTALAELDSDGDGAITAADERFSELVLWSDYDHDRRSTLWELEPLAARGVVSIALDSVDEPRCDARGNCARERSVAEMMVGGRPVSASVVDVYLTCQ